ncbi:MAG TPA: hypothetical protein VJ851_18515 [Jatrophihabitans sp.]|nr:hypothetical protein [Jatrophihabitans sp.]
MRIPVFVSSPTHLSGAQEASRDTIMKVLDSLGLEPRALGRREYPSDYPLREVAVIARHCSGGMILGFEQFRSLNGVKNPGTSREHGVSEPTAFPTPWNQLEAGILFGLRLPLVIFREPGITGGVFDNGVTDVFLQGMPPAKPSRLQMEELREVLLRWHGRVQEHYYRLD